MDMTTAYHKADVYSIESWYDVDDKTHKILSTEKLAYRILLRHGKEREEILHVLQALGVLPPLDATTVLETTGQCRATAAAAADGYCYYYFQIYNTKTRKPLYHVRICTEIAGYGI